MMGFATISPVVGLYAVVLVGATIAGPRWVWALPVCLAGQCLLLALYAELSSEFPISGGAYQWTRRLLGPSYAWLTGCIGHIRLGRPGTALNFGAVTCNRPTWTGRCPTTRTTG
ncbi:amino acid permease [Saccharopolyspora elongata]|uniref:Amino acid permease n=2 Tax=Saccharopolyspora elongata TaxID=2530387 RepID=A0A4V2YNH7_9PSEU|nr:amino acid permease [Saccharopolyspora elongata]